MKHVVVVAEDNPADAEMLRIALAEVAAPVDIVVFEDGPQLLRFLGVEGGVWPEQSRCDLVLLDLNLPRISGFDLLAQIKKAKHLQDLPVVIMSGSANSEDIERCYRLGAESYICKPTRLDEIFAAANQIVARLKAGKVPYAGASGSAP